MAIIDFVEWNPGDDQIFAWKFPETNLSTNTQLLVRESQEAIVFIDGTILGRFKPGRHTLTTSNLPLLRTLYGIPFGGKNPFKAEVWYINHLSRLILDWKVSNISNHDADYNAMVPLSAWGTFSIKITDIECFLKEVVGTSDSFDADMLRRFALGEFNAKIKPALSQFLITHRVGLKSITAYMDSISENLQLILTPFWEKYGIQLSSFFLTEIEIDTGTEIGRKAAEGIASQSNQFVSGHSWQQAKMMDIAEKAVSGISSGSGGLLGAVLASNMLGGIGGGTMQSTYNQGQPSFGGTTSQQNTPEITATTTRFVYCSNCSKKFASYAKFCPHCGDPYCPCPACGADNKKEAKRCVSCGKVLYIGTDKACSNCKFPVPPGSAFCSNCGHPQSENHCSQCGTPLLNAKFCSACGKKN